MSAYNLSVHYFAGFQESVTVQHPCRFCMVKRSDSKESIWVQNQSGSWQASFWSFREPTSGERLYVRSLCFKWQFGTFPHFHLTPCMTSWKVSSLLRWLCALMTWSQRSTSPFTPWTKSSNIVLTNSQTELISLKLSLPHMPLDVQLVVTATETGSHKTSSTHDWFWCPREWSKMGNFWRTS